MVGGRWARFFALTPFDCGEPQPGERGGRRWPGRLGEREYGHSAQISQCNFRIDFSRSEYAVGKYSKYAVTQQLEVRNREVRSISSSREVRNTCPPHEAAQGAGSRTRGAGVTQCAVRGILIDAVAADCCPVGLYCLSAAHYFSATALAGGATMPPVAGSKHPWSTRSSSTSVDLRPSGKA